MRKWAEMGIDQSGIYVSPLLSTPIIQGRTKGGIRVYWVDLTEDKHQIALMNNTSSVYQVERNVCSDRIRNGSKGHGDIFPAQSEAPLRDEHLRFLGYVCFQCIMYTSSASVRHGRAGGQSQQHHDSIPSEISQQPV
jgi:hypothetical protein